MHDNGTILAMERVGFSRGQANLVDFSLTVGPGDIVCLLGNNGAGKSTILKLCAGLLAPRTGRIFCRGRDLSCIAYGDRRRILSYLPQGSHRIEGTGALRFVALADEFERFVCGNDLPSAAEDAWYRECLDAFDALHLAERDVAALSGGEWGRVQLARVWAQRARLVLLDEPDTGLDIRHVGVLARRCLEIRGRAESGIIMSTHDVNLALSVATHVVLLDSGRVVCAGAPATVVRSGQLQELFGVEFVLVGDGPVPRLLPLY